MGCECNVPILVEIDEELKSIVPAFLESRFQDCSTITRHLETGFMDEIKTLGHRMKGAGGSYGFDEISELGEMIENGATASDTRLIQEAVTRLDRYLSRVTVEYV